MTNKFISTLLVVLIIIVATLILLIPDRPLSGHVTTVHNLRTTTQTQISGEVVDIQYLRGSWYSPQYAKVYIKSDNPIPTSSPVTLVTVPISDIPANVGVHSHITLMDITSVCIGGDSPDCRANHVALFLPYINGTGTIGTTGPTGSNWELGPTGNIIDTQPQPVPQRQRQRQPSTIVHQPAKPTS